MNDDQWQENDCIASFCVHKHAEVSTSSFWPSVEQENRNKERASFNAWSDEIRELAFKYATMAGVPIRFCRLVPFSPDDPRLIGIRVVFTFNNRGSNSDLFISAPKKIPGLVPENEIDPAEILAAVRRIV